MNKSQNADKYVESRRCETYEYESYPMKNCQIDEIYCPTKDECLGHVDYCEAHFYFGNETQCKNQGMHHCPESNQCIWQDWVCDGFVQCFKGDDEDFELCNEWESFAEGATVKCPEAERFGYDVTILATKCNGVTECRNGIDETDCLNDDSSGLIAFGILFIAIAVIWIIIFLTFTNGDFSQESNFDPNAVHFKGDELSSIKVIFHDSKHF